MATLAPDFTPRAACRLLSVNPSTYYRRRQVEQRPVQEDGLLPAVEAIVEEFPGYGYRRVTKELQRRGWRLNNKSRDGLRPTRWAGVARHARGRAAVPTQAGL